MRAKRAFPCVYGTTRSSVPWNMRIGHFTFLMLLRFGNGSIGSIRMRVTTRGAERNGASRTSPPTGRVAAIFTPFVPMSTYPSVDSSYPPLLISGWNMSRLMHPIPTSNAKATTQTATLHIDLTIDFISHVRKCGGALRGVDVFAAKKQEPRRYAENHGPYADEEHRPRAELEDERHGHRHPHASHQRFVEKLLATEHG